MRLLCLGMYNNVACTYYYMLIIYYYYDTVEPLYKDTLHKDNRVSKDMDQGPDDICM